MQALLLLAALTFHGISDAVANFLDLHGALFSDEMDNFANQSSGSNLFRTFLNDRVQTTETEIDGAATVAYIYGGIKRKLDDRSHKLLELKEIVEREYARFCLTPWYRSCCSVRLNDAHYDEHFRTRVDKDNMCYIHPSYARNTRYATAPVYRAFKMNLLSVTDIKYQYIALSNSEQTVYPARQEAECDDYDPRLTPWYASTAIPRRKYVAIIIDNSGGMAGDFQGRSPHEVAKYTAKAILKTLSQNDKVAVVEFSRQATSSQSEDCFRLRLAAGTMYNIQTLTDFIDNLAYTGQSYYAVGLEEALTIFKNERESAAEVDPLIKWVIFFISAADPQDATAAVDNAFSNTDADEIPDLTVIAYAVGTRVGESVKNRLQYIADKGHRGKFIALNSVSSLADDIVKFYNVFEPTDSNTPVLMCPYFSDTGLGLITSMTLPIYDSLTETFKGVVGIDIHLDDLLADVIFENGKLSLPQSRPKGYAFLSDVLPDSERDVYVLAHPLLSIPDRITSDPAYFAIHDVETADEIQDVKADMLAGRDGHQTFMSKWYYENGEFYSESSFSNTVNTTIYYRAIEDTHYYISYVYKEGDRFIDYQYEGDYARFTYHRLDYQPNLETCKHFFRLALAHQSAVKFAPTAFLDERDYMNNENYGRIQLYKSIIGAESEIDMFRPGVVEDVYITAYMEEQWHDGQVASFRNSHVVWRFIGTETGVFRIYPGIQIESTFDPRNRLWYSRAVADYTHFNRYYAVSCPYLDGFGSGYVVTFSEVLVKDGVDDIYGVMGSDVFIHYFYYLVLQTYDECKSDGYNCMVIDNAGFVIAHSIWVEADWVEAPSIEGAHLVTMEPFIAEHMIENNHLKAKACNNLNARMENAFFETQESLNDLQIADFYESVRIPDTNLFIIVKHEAAMVTDEHECVCGDKEEEEMAPECRRLANGTCECPCFRQNRYDNCRNTFDTDNQPCYPRNALYVITDFESEEDRLRGKEQCAARANCGEKDLDECNQVAACRVCNRDDDGRPLAEPYCGTFDECWFGQVGQESPFARTDPRSALKSEGANLGAIAAGVMVAFFIVSVGSIGGFVAFRRYQDRKLAQLEAEYDRAGADVT